MPDIVALSVRGLVEHVFLSGSLDSGFRSAGALVEGTKAHQKIQQQYREQDRKEVYLSAEVPCEDLLFVLEGRCDGLLLDDDGGVTIEEIKSTAGDIALLTEGDTPRVHWAQAQFYAYMHAKEHGIGRLRVRLTYVQVDTEAQRRFEREATLAQLTEFVQNTVARYAPFARLLERNRRLRDESIRELSFPFPEYRAGQRKLVGSVYKAIEEGRKLFAKAPTGIGKTISTLFPTIKAIGLGKIRHFFYLTARTTTRAAAEDALAQMRSRGLHLHAVTITAKEKICFQDEVDCRKEKCPYADGYYDRINGAIYDLLENETTMDRPVIERVARKHCVCPFEMSLDVAYRADAVICDYNYIFDPRVSLKRLAGEVKGQTVLLLDEAHNLIDRAREMYSAALDKRDFLELEREFKGSRPSVHSAAKAVNKWFIEARKKSDGQASVRKESPEELLELIEAFAAAAERELLAGGAAASERLTDVYFAALSFLRIGKLYDDAYVTYVTCERNEVTVKMFCLNPSHLLRSMGKGFRAHVFFSATLTPLTYFMEMLGAEGEDYSVTLGSPFDRSQWDVSILPLSTRYKDRERTKAPLAETLRKLVADRGPGNYLFFFPSYAYMNGVYEVFQEGGGEVRLLLQMAGMTEAERDGYLAAFEAGNKGTLVGFAVMGGVFSEGIDLVGDRLRGVAVIGVGMPQIGLERDLIKTYFDENGGDGFNYAYVYPGMNKVLQAGGRLIRSEQDRGVLALIDDRYLQHPYARLLPEEWRGG